MSSHGQAAWELLLPAVGAPARRRGRVLQEALREAVRSGRLAAGTRLPSTRALATDLGVSRGLVTEAYEQLTAEGYLRSDRGAGTWVGDAARGRLTGRNGAAVGSTGSAGPGRTGAAEGSGGPRPLGGTHARGARGASLGAYPHRAHGPAPGAPGVLVDFHPGTPDLSLFPRAAWSAAQRAVLARLAHPALGYPDPRGLPELREALAGMLTRRRGVVADPERLVVCSGVAQASTLLGFVLRARGLDAVGIEDPGSPEHGRLFASTGLDTVWLPLDEEGLCPAPLAASGVRAVVVTPSHQFPSGISWSAERRAALLDWARAVDGYVLEDDYDGDFRYDRAPVGALQGLDPERVVYAGSVSKSLAPGLRLGWMLVPEALLGEVVERKRTMDLGNPVLDQAVLAEFVTRGGYDRQLRRCQRAYRERRDALLAALAEHLPGTGVSGIAAGLHVIARVPARYGPPERFLARAAEAGVALRPLEDYGTARPGDGDVRLVIGYAHLTPSAVTTGVRLVAEAAGRE
ncbi:PLP-dependent aminotransferase family protein [Streptomyces sp. NBC_00572]|uniref:MocR-like pyridoxine biosynthesis transcription factor PdxR n=1 Tax=Streptomyces sp. NBC_00572 TaxID=2903664 RepID=UPI0022518F50|nr:PLP-dependent aminotransferase family protein [Streptomyces sp. NBC_00572]MCX4986879.1 PLP-dependent aminotransferase family protein [Streptomyces sp. NBC_00572]